MDPDETQDSEEGSRREIDTQSILRQLQGNDEVDDQSIDSRISTDGLTELEKFQIKIMRAGFGWRLLAVILFASLIGCAVKGLWLLAAINYVVGWGCWRLSSVAQQRVSPLSYGFLPNAIGPVIRFLFWPLVLWQDIRGNWSLRPPREKLTRERESRSLQKQAHRNVKRMERRRQR